MRPGKTSLRARCDAHEVFAQPSIELINRLVAPGSLQYPVFALRIGPSSVPSPRASHHRPARGDNPFFLTRRHSDGGFFRHPASAGPTRGRRHGSSSTAPLAYHARVRQLHRPDRLLGVDPLSTHCWPKARAGADPRTLPPDRLPTSRMIRTTFLDGRVSSLEPRCCAIANRAKVGSIINRCRSPRA